MNRKRLLPIGSLITLIALLIWGCSEFEIDNPFYEKDGIWEDPFNLTAVNNPEDSGQILLQWAEPQNVDIESYRLFRAVEDSANFDVDGKSSEYTIGTGEKSYLDTNGLEGGENYYYQIAAIIGGKESRRSDITPAVRPIRSIADLTIISSTQGRLETSDTLPFNYINYEQVFLTLINRGNAATTVGSITASTPSWLKILGETSFTLDPDTNVTKLCTLAVDWDSLEVDPQTKFGTVTFNSNAGPIAITVGARKVEQEGVLTLLDSIQLDFGTLEDEVTISLKNTGNAAIPACTLSTPVNWMSIDSTDTVIIKDIAVNQVVTTVIRVDRELMTEDTSETKIRGAYGSTALTIDVYARKQLQAELTLVDAPDTLDFGEDGDTVTVTVQNTGKGTLNLLKPTLSVNDWVVLADWGTSDTLPLGSMEMKVIKLAANRDTIAPGTYFGKLYLATLTDSSASLDLKITKINPALPHLTISAGADTLVDTVVFNPDNSRKTIKIQNTGSGILKVVRPTDGGAAWLEPDSGWGTTDTISVPADSTKLFTMKGDTALLDELNTEYKTVVMIEATNAESDSIVVVFSKSTHDADTVNLTTGDVTYNSAALGWTASKSAYFTQYRIYRDTTINVSNNENLFVDSITVQDSLSFTDTDLTSMKQYFYRVYVVTDGGIEKGGASNIDSATTLPKTVVRGIVANKNNTDLLIEGAVVTLTVGSESFVDTTDADGKYGFLFAAAPEGKGSIAVTKVDEGDNIYLDATVPVTVTADPGVISANVGMTVVTIGTQANQGLEDGGQPFTSMAVYNNRIFMYGYDADAFENGMLVWRYNPTGNEYSTKRHLSDSPKNNITGVDLVNGYDGVYAPYYGDTTLDIWNETTSEFEKKPGREGAILKIDELGQEINVEVKGVPVAIQENSANIYVMTKNGNLGDGFIKRFSQGLTDLTGSGDVSIGINNNSWQIDGDVIQDMWPVMRLNDQSVYFTTGISDTRRIIKLSLDLLVEKQIAYPSDISHVSDMELYNNSVYVTDHSKLLYIYDENLGNQTTVSFPQSVSDVVVLGTDVTDPMGEYLLILPKMDLNSVDAGRDCYLFSGKEQKIVKTISLTNSPTSAVMFNSDSLYVATAQSGTFTNFNVISVVK